MTNLEAIRLARGESRNALAVAVDVSRTTIIKLETGETEEPTYSLVVALAEHFSVLPESLFLPDHSDTSLQTDLVDHEQQQEADLLNAQIAAPTPPTEAPAPAQENV